jgi:hypothetical protein
MTVLRLRRASASTVPAISFRDVLLANHVSMAAPAVVGTVATTPVDRPTPRS